MHVTAALLAQYGFVFDGSEPWAPGSSREAAERRAFQSILDRSFSQARNSKALSQPCPLHVQPNS